MSAKSSTMSSAEKTKETKLKKQHSLITKNQDTTSHSKESLGATPTALANKNKDATHDKSQTNEEKFKQFEDDGVVFKTKLIGSELVMEPRGDKMCQNSIQRLKAIIKGQKAHKKRIVMKISYSGVKIYDEKTNELLYHHEVPQISFISSDDTDSRTFGYVCDVPNKAHQFICFKTSGPALQIMSVISSLFEAVLEKKKREEQESGDNNNSSSMSNNNTQQKQEQSDSILDDQLIIQDKSMTPPPAKTSEEHSNPSQESATVELTRQLGHTLSFSSPMDLIDGGDSGIIESPSTTFNEWSLPPPPPTSHQSKQAVRYQQPPASIHERSSLLSLNSSSPITTGNARMVTPATSLVTSTRVPPSTASNQNKSLVYNHSSVSLNDAVLSNRSTFVSPTATGHSDESTDRYAVFNDIDNLPSIFESTSSLGSKANLSNINDAVDVPTTPASTASPFDQRFGGPPQAQAKSLQSSAGRSFDSSNLAHSNAMFFTSHQVPSSPPRVSAGDDPFHGVDQHYQQHQQQQRTQYQQHQFQQPQLLNQLRPAPTPSMMVPNNPVTSNSFAFGPNSGSGMIVGSAPMGGHQMSAHARFSSSMVAGLHQRLGSSAASIQSVGSAGGLSRQTNPFDDDFFS